MENQNLIAFLKNNELLKGLSDSVLKSIASYTTQHNFPANTSFISQEETANRVFIVVTGTVRIYRLTEEGKEVGLAIRGAGEVVGEMAFLNENKRSANVEALQDTTAVSISGEVFKKLLLDHPVIGINLLEILTKRLVENGEYIEEITSRSLKQRTFDMLRVLANYFPNHTIRLSQEELATIIGATRARVTEVLHLLQKEGKVNLHHKMIHVI